MVDKDETIEEMPPIAITHAGSQVFQLTVYLGRALRDPAETPNLLDALSLRGVRAGNQ